MKTQIIRLEPHDDAISVKDKMEWRQTPRILLVWPSRGPILNRQLDMVFLKRHAVSMGAQLALVTHDPEVKYYADRLEIQVYSTIRKAEKTHWRQPRHRRKKRRPNLTDIDQIPIPDEPERERPDLMQLRQIAHPASAAWLAHPITRIVAFTLGVLGVLAIAALLLPGAEISLTPKIQTERIIFGVTAHPQNESVDLSGSVPAQSIPIIVEGRSALPSTGRISIPLETATGEISLTNLTDQPIQVPAGTIITTIGEDPVRFTISELIEVLPQETNENINVQAVNPGSKGNVLHKEVTAIEGPLGLVLTVTNPRRFSGGSDRIIPAPDEGDYEALKIQLLEDLHKSALAELNFVLAEDDRLIYAEPSDFQVIEETYYPETREPADQLELTLRVEFRFLAASGDDLKKLGSAILESHLPAGFSALPATIEIESQGDVAALEDGGFRWQTSAQWQVTARVDEIQAVRLVLWQTPQTAKEALNGNLPVQDAAIRLTPAWWPRLPILPFRIAVLSAR